MSATLQQQIEELRRSPARNDTSYNSAIDDVLALPAIRALLETPEQRLSDGVWRPIESAPKDGKVVLLAREVGDGWGWVIGYGHWESAHGISGWIARGFFEPPGNLGLAHPTYWLPVPRPDRVVVQSPQTIAPTVTAGMQVEGERGVWSLRSASARP